MDRRDILDRHRVLRILLGLVTILVAMWVISIVWTLLASVGDIVLLFFLAWVVASILAPVSNFLITATLQACWPSRWSTLRCWVVISGAIVLLVPALQSQVTQLAEEIETQISQPSDWSRSIRAWLMCSTVSASRKMTRSTSSRKSRSRYLAGLARWRTTR